jgi:hypothetical protein
MSAPLRVDAATKAKGGVDATSSINEQRQRAVVEIALINTATHH